MGLLPTFSPNKPQWRGSTSSTEMNENFDEILYDLNTIFSEATQMVVDLNDLESRIRHDVEALNERIYSVSGIITAYDQSATNYKMFYENFYLPDNVLYPAAVKEEDKCIVDSEFGTVTLPINNSFSKVYTVNISDGKVIVAPDLVVDVVPYDEAGSVKVEEVSPTRAFDGQDSTVWERRVRFSRDSIKSNVICQMSVKLPSMSNPYVNKVHIKPYPEGTEDVSLITYDTLVSQDVVLPNFPADGENNIQSKMYSFNNIQPVKMKFFFRQRSSRLEDDYKTFVYGAKEIGIEKVEYKSSGKVGVLFKLPSYEVGLLRYITLFRTDPNYDNINYKFSIYTSQAEFDANLPKWTSSNSPITASNMLDVSAYGLDRIWVMAQLVQGASDTKTPMLKSITMTYTTT